MFHNLRGYDSHLIFKELSKSDCNIDVIPNGLQKYMSLNLNKKSIVFVDSMLFMNSSLDKLVKNLNDFKYLSCVFKGEQLELVKQKGTYPYEYMNSSKRFKEDNLPDIDCFFNSLNDCGITDEEYSRAFNVWKVFNINNLGEYHDLYLKTDVLWLCDVFEKFIDVCLKDYGLDPCHYVSSSGLSWDAMLKMTGIRLEEINDIDMYLFLEKGMRKGVLCISKRYAESEENTDIMYWNMNNLYGTVMSFDYLPYGGFKWLSKKEIKRFDLDSIPRNGKIGDILEVDLEYCKELHDIHNEHIPEHISVNYEMLSNYCKNIVDRCNIKVGGVKKLIPNLHDKIKYPVHNINLKYYLSLEMMLKKIHRILKFKQKNWLKVFTDFNTQKRRMSNDEFNKKLYKLFNNCIYDKSIENARKKNNVKLVNDKKISEDC